VQLETRSGGRGPYSIEESGRPLRTSKTEQGVRSIALSPALAEALWQHRRGSTFKGDDERVFCHQFE
jgi:hypothetical protein